MTMNCFIVGLDERSGPMITVVNRRLHSLIKGRTLFRKPWRALIRTITQQVLPTSCTLRRYSPYGTQTFLTWRVAQALILIFSTHTGQRVPHPCVVCKRGSRRSGCGSCVPISKWKRKNRPPLVLICQRGQRLGHRPPDIIVVDDDQERLKESATRPNFDILLVIDSSFTDELLSHFYHQ